MKKLICLLCSAASLLAADLSDSQVVAIRKAVAAAPLAELPSTVGKLVKDAKPADRNNTARIALQLVKLRAPQALDASNDQVPAENRPPVTPGNEHGNRPTVPPGLNNYGTP